MIIASLLCSYPIPSGLTTFSQRIYNFPSSPSFMQSGKMLIIYYTQINPQAIFISQAEFLQEFQFPQEFTASANGEVSTDIHTSTPQQDKGQLCHFFVTNEWNLVWKLLRTNPQSPSTTGEAGGSIRCCNFRPSS